jgi:2-polyprenyl-3-methyl-5-hydroxy-6-metoxy-1,4-benzoquinol methylase
MQDMGTVELNVQPKVLKDVFEYILQEAKAKTVLNVGAVGGVEGYLPHRQETWLHHRLSQVAGELIGIDIDQESIAYAAEHGVHVLHADCESMQLEKRFDLIIMSDVIEHLNAPGRALKTLIEHLNPGGKLFITTPNPTHYGLIGRALLGGKLNIYYDHVMLFMPEHIQALCNRFGYHLSEVYFFGHVDQRSMSSYLKSAAGRLMGWMSKRLHGAFLAVVEPNKPELVR